MLPRMFRVGSAAAPYLRVALALLLLQLGFSAWALRAARASVGEVMLTLGAQLMLYKNARTQSAPRQLVLNGLELNLSTGTSSDPPRAVLDQFAVMCKGRAGHVGQQFDALRGRLAQEGADLGLLDGVLRAGDERRGVVACLDVGTERLTIDELARRVERFVESGDVSEVGSLRYVSVEGDASGSFFVALWSEGALKLGHAFPAQGDVPGVDSEQVPRPERSRRILSAWESGGEGINVYLSEHSDPEHLDAFYRENLPKLGFKLLTQKAKKALDTRGLVAERAGKMVAFSFSKAKEGQSTVTIQPL